MIPSLLEISLVWNDARDLSFPLTSARITAKPEAELRTPPPAEGLGFRIGKRPTGRVR